MSRNLRVNCFFIVFCLFAPLAHASCGASFCTLNTSWESQGVSSQPGATFDLRYEYIDQDQPRAGRDKISVGAIPRDHDEVRTLNRNVLATIDYTPDADNGISLQLPFVKRDHEHIHNDVGGPLEEAWHFEGVGDVRLVGRHRLVSNSKITGGALAGIKLPTGSTKKTNEEGELAERSLQPGTGTTDLIIGAFAGAMRMLGNEPVRYFAQAQWQAPLNSAEDYRPGNKYSIDAGIIFPADAPLSSMLQLNVLIKDRDRGGEAEAGDSGGSFAWLSPGVSYTLSHDTQIYSFVQLPVYQRVNGVQLTANRAAAAGVHWRF